MLLPILAAAALTIPADPIARARFPNEPVEAVDAIAFINKVVNASIVYTPDKKHYGSTDKWVSFPKDRKGDCEDYAITKFVALENGDFPVVERARVRTVIVHDQGKDWGHAILEVRLPNGSIMELDNNFDEPMRREDLERDHQYTFFDW